MTGYILEDAAAEVSRMARTGRVVIRPQMKGFRNLENIGKDTGIVLELTCVDRLVIADTLDYNLDDFLRLFRNLKLTTLCIWDFRSQSSIISEIIQGCRSLVCVKIINSVFTFEEQECIVKSISRHSSLKILSLVDFKYSNFGQDVVEILYKCLDLKKIELNYQQQYVGIFNALANHKRIIMADLIFPLTDFRYLEPILLENTVIQKLAIGECSGSSGLILSQKSSLEQLSIKTNSNQLRRFQIEFETSLSLRNAIRNSFVYEILSLSRTLLILPFPFELKEFVFDFILDTIGDSNLNILKTLKQVLLDRILIGKLKSTKTCVYSIFIQICSNLCNLTLVQDEILKAEEPYPSNVITVKHWAN